MPELIKRLLGCPLIDIRGDGTPVSQRTSDDEAEAREVEIVDSERTTIHANGFPLSRYVSGWPSKPSKIGSRIRNEDL